ncbi:MAG: 2-oxo acid dehydrogenase subunit E2 [Caldilineaceae bacterium]|nr:2-oxo acid dehydrogenase subunit E2 [Caldilineaceae bacterium]
MSQDTHRPNANTVSAAGYRTEPFPRMRQLVLDAGWMARRRHMIHAFVEFDVTSPRQQIAAYRARTGEKLSFSAFVSACVGRAVAADPHVHAYRNWRNRLVIFDDVDILMVVEMAVGARTFPLVHNLRATNRRTVLDLHREIRAIQAEPERSVAAQSPLMRGYYRLPALVRRSIYRFMEANPQWRCRVSGTVGLTSVGMFGEGSGWGMGAPNHTLGIVLGGIACKPAYVNGNIEPRDFLCVTISFDHDIVDGAPAARFTQKFRELVEAGAGLPEIDAR